MAINYKMLAVAFVLIGATTAGARADDLAAQFGAGSGGCFRSGWNSVACAPEAPRYFNQADREQARHIRPRH
jgi:hypothetical protein